MLAASTGWLLGVVLGMRHALEPDHLTAVSALVTEERGARRGALLGVAWGAGHTLALLAVGVALALLEAEMPARLAVAFELGVSAMLVALGARNLARAWRLGREGPVRRHAHGGRAHAHAGGLPHVHLGSVALARRPLLIGVVHGLAGSGSLTALVLAGLPSTGARLLYIGLFGLGSAAGMALLSGLAGWPLARLAREPRAARGVLWATGLLSAGLGVLSGARLLA